MGDLTKNFSKFEFNCPCCGRNNIQQFFVEKLQEIRDFYGAAMMVSSGWRCHEHNTKIGGSKSSAHMDGIAADIICRGTVNRYDLVKFATMCNAKGVGVYDQHVHIDLKKRGEDVMWVGKST